LRHVWATSGERCDPSQQSAPDLSQEQSASTRAGSFDVSPVDGDHSNTDSVTACTWAARLGVNLATHGVEQASVITRPVTGRIFTERKCGSHLHGRPHPATTTPGNTKASPWGGFASMTGPVSQLARGGGVIAEPSDQGVRRGSLLRIPWIAAGNPMAEAGDLSRQSSRMAMGSLCIGLSHRVGSMVQRE